MESILKYFNKRKGFVTFLILVVVPFLKVLLHYFISPFCETAKATKNLNFYDLDEKIVTKFKAFYFDLVDNSIKKCLDFSEHFGLLFEEQVFLFIPSVVIVILVVWNFSDKIDDLLDEIKNQLKKSIKKIKNHFVVKKVKENLFPIFMVSLIMVAVGSIIVQELEERNKWKESVKLERIENNIIMNALNERGIDSLDFQNNIGFSRFSSIRFYVKLEGDINEKGELNISKTFINQIKNRIKKHKSNEKIIINALNEAGFDTSNFEEAKQSNSLSEVLYDLKNLINNRKLIIPEEKLKEINIYLKKKTITKKVIENFTLNNPQSISSVFDNDKIIKDLGLDVNDLKSTDGKLNFSKGDGYSSGHPNGSVEQLYYYAGKLSSYLFKSGQAEKVAKYIEKSYKKKLQVWDANEYHSAWILKNNPHLWKYINDL